MVSFVCGLAFGVLLGISEVRALTDEKVPTGTEELSSEDGTEKWGYVNVRKRAHMFYWFYYTSHPSGYKKRPWIIWLQGGPGASSCGYGNFEVIGPLTVDLRPRNTTWVKQASVLFVDAPVGAGFSYVDDPSAYNTEIIHTIDDLMKFIRVFLKRSPIFKTRPLYIFGQSYGGKVAAHFAQRLHDEIQKRSIKAQLVGFAMGNAWISPIDSTLNYADFLYWMSLVDEKGRDLIKEGAERVKDAINAGNWTLADSNYWRTTKKLMYNQTNHVNIYDIRKFLTDEAPDEVDPLEVIMNDVIRDKLRIVPPNITWSGSRNETFQQLTEEFMKPSVSVVDDVLQNTDLQVIVYQGQFDIICNTKAANDWVQQFKWSNLSSYNESFRTAFRNPDDNQTESFVKAFGKFKFYNILGAGHSVPRDKGDAAYRMLDRILNNLDQ